MLAMPNLYKKCQYPASSHSIHELKEGISVPGGKLRDHHSVAPCFVTVHICAWCEHGLSMCMVEHIL